MGEVVDLEASGANFGPAAIADRPATGDRLWPCLFFAATPS